MKRILSAAVLAMGLSMLSTAPAVEVTVGAQATELPQPIQSKVDALAKQGDNLVRQTKYREAVAQYVQALELLPEPRKQWGACTWLLAAIGDANFLGGHYERARNALSDAMQCPGAIGNPFIHLRLGQAQLELGNRERAADELARAYMGAGKDIFASENPKYFEFLKSVLEPPANGQW